VKGVWDIAFPGVKDSTQRRRRRKGTHIEERLGKS
jgi:hypothetical protein